MDGFTVIDAIVAGVIVISAVLAYARGFIREILAIGGWILAALVAYAFAPRAVPLMAEIPLIGGFIGDSCELGIIVAFAVIFALALAVISLFTPLFSAAVQRSALSVVDSTLGFLFGALRGVLVVVLALMLYDIVAAQDPVAIVAESRSAQIFGQLQDYIRAQIPDDGFGWLAPYYDNLVDACLPASDA
jgi:membrane protein required for colicin V production